MSNTTNSGMVGSPPTVKIDSPKKKENIYLHHVIAPGTGRMFEPTEQKVDIVQPSDEQILEFLEENMPTDEEEKYRKCWKVDEYRDNSPGADNVPHFLEWAGDIPPGSTIIDWGCGTGKASKLLYEQTDLDITMIDFAENCLDDDIRELAKNNPRLRFVKYDLTKKGDFFSDYGFCADVMEHIPTEDVTKVLSNILLSSKKVFFEICTAHDGFGAHPDIGETLHLTVENYFEWLQRFRDQAVIIMRSEQHKHSVSFYVNGWWEPTFRPQDMRLNVEDSVACDNLIANASLGLQHVRPHKKQDIEIMLVCGGSSALDFKDEIIEKREAGMPLVTVNGSFNMVIDWGLSPSLQCVLDSREFNKRFVQVIPGYTDTTKFVLSTQCDPSLFVGLPEDRTYLWDLCGTRELVALTKEHYGEMYVDWFPCGGGSTVTLRAINLLKILGFSKVHIYGMDSCNSDKHHAYDQPENDGAKTVSVTVGEKEFQCEGWQIYQAQDFLRTVPRLFMEIDLIVYGPGLIAALIEDAASKDAVDMQFPATI